MPVNARSGRGAPRPCAAAHTGSTALHCAGQRGDVALLRALLDLAADPGLKDDAGCTPLDRARAVFGDADLPQPIAALLEPGISPPAATVAVAVV